MSRVGRWRRLGAWARGGLVCALCACSDREDSAVPPGCDTGPDTGFQVGELDPGCRCEDAVVRAGTGELAFTPLVPGQDLTLIHGPQNGWHLSGAVEVSYTRDVVALQLEVLYGGQRVTPELASRVLLVEAGPCVGTLPNLFLYLDTTALSASATPPEVLACQTLEVRMCAEDSGGRGACDTVAVRAVPDPLDVESGLVAACP